MEKKISVIVPVYHPIKEYLDRLLDSIVRQTLGIESIEILLVSDGDCSEATKEMLFYWEKRYPENIIVIFYEENRKPGYARTLGIESSNGEYIAFADQDDWIALEMYRVLYNRAKEENAEIAGGFSTRDRKYERPEIMRNYTGAPDKLWEINTIQERKQFLREKEMGGYWCSIYRRAFLFEHDIYFPEGLTYDDNFFGALCLFYVKKVLVLGEYFYHWFVNKKSISMLHNGNTHFDRTEIELLKIKTYKARGLFDYYKEEIEVEFLRMYFINTWHIFFFNLDYIPYNTYIEMCQTIHREFPEYRNNPYLYSGKMVDNYMIFPLFAMFWNDFTQKGDFENLQFLKTIPKNIREISWLDMMDGKMTEEELQWYKKICRLLSD